MDKAQAKRMAWSRAVRLVEEESGDWQLNPKKFSRHDQVRFEEAVDDVLEEMTRRGAPSQKRKSSEDGS